MTKPLSHERLEAEEHWCEYITNMKNHPDWKPFDNNFIDKSLKDMMRFAYISGFLTGRKHGIAYPDRLEGGCTDCACWIPACTTRAEVKEMLDV